MPSAGPPTSTSATPSLRSPRPASPPAGYRFRRQAFGFRAGPRSTSMPETTIMRLSDLVARNERQLLDAWLRYQLAGTGRRELREDDLRSQSRQFLEHLARAMRDNNDP